MEGFKTYFFCRFLVTSSGPGCSLEKIQNLRNKTAPFAAISRGNYVSFDCEECLSGISLPARICSSIKMSITECRIVYCATFVSLTYGGNCAKQKTIKESMPIFCSGNETTSSRGAFQYSSVSVSALFYLLRKVHRTDRVQAYAEEKKEGIERAEDSMEEE